MVEKLTVRAAHAADAPAIAGILRAIGWFGHVSAEPFGDTEGRVQSVFTQRGDNDTLLVAVSGHNEFGDDEIAGYIAAHWATSFVVGGVEGYISELFVHPAHQGQGVGRTLLNALEAEAKECGCLRLMLLNRYERDSDQRGFYPKMGWKEREDMAVFMRYLGESGYT